DTDPTGEPACEPEGDWAYPQGTALSWVTRMTGPQAQRTSDLLVLDDGRILVAGQADGHEVILGADQPGGVVWTDPTYDPFFLVALEPSGALDWSYVIPNEGSLVTTELALRGDGSVWMGGRVDAFDETLFTWPNGSIQALTEQGVFISRMSAAGQLQALWTYDARSIGGLAVAPGDTLVTGGVYWSTEVFGPGQPGQTVLSANGGAIDEAYVAYAPDGSSLWRADAPSNQVHMGTLSKVGLAALRVGYCIAHPLLALAMNKVRHPYNVSQTSLVLAQAVLERFAPVQAAMLARARDNRARLAEVLAAIPGATVLPSAGNLVVVRLRGPDDAPRLHAHLAAHDVLVKDVSRLPRLERCLRVSVGTTAELDRLERALASWSPSSSPADTLPRTS
ncbi:MAG: aminotransferase class I/II-fold pyridoxal phosphate-dependent enzyme, partial [Myxococcales bacterium]|nr:aminotransferase class I/II-fold pyridoxal phosphate-dependent enzyme [Myxococcales bacterium]